MEAKNEFEEWVYLMLEAKNSGLSIEEVHDFIVEIGSREKLHQAICTLGKAVIQSSFLFSLPEITVKGQLNR